MTKVTVTIAYPVTIIVDIPEGLDEFDARDIAFDEADKVIATGGIKPIITESSDESIIPS